MSAFDPRRTLGAGRKALEEVGQFSEIGPMPNVLRLVRMSATFSGLLRRSSDVVRARSAKASIACQNIASAVAVFERAILAVPIPVTCAHVDQRAPRSLCALRVFWAEVYRCKTSRSHQNRAYHHLSNSMQCLVRHQEVVAIPLYSWPLSICW
jgi:hypothetical protein